MQIRISLPYLNGIKMITSEQFITSTFLTRGFTHCFLHVKWNVWVITDILNFVLINSFVSLFIYSFIAFLC